MLIPLSLVVGYALGFTGWVWDWLAHLGAVEGMALAHLLMSCSSVLVLAPLVQWFRGGMGYLAAYGWLVVGLVLTLGPILAMEGTAPEVRRLLAAAGGLTLLPIPLRAAWLRVQAGKPGLWPGVAAAGISVVLSGVIVDMFWHNANPGVEEMNLNMLLLPGHQIQLVGWVVGLVGASVVVAQSVRRAAPSRGPRR